MALGERLHAAARNGITFRDWMDACLYDGAAGYYTRRRTRPRTGAGDDADFATAPTLHPFMAQCVAAEIASTWTALGKPDDFIVVEHGGGSGDLARDALDALQAQHGWWPVWHHVEVSEDHRQEQMVPAAGRGPGAAGTPGGDTGTRDAAAAGADTKSADSPDPATPDARGRDAQTANMGAAGADASGASATRTETADAPAGPAGSASGRIRHGPAPQGFVGCVVAHEFLDALPVHLMERRKGHWAELYVRAEGSAVELTTGFPTKAGTDAAPRIELPEGHRVAAHAGAKAWLADVGRRLDAGRVLVVDYGDEEQVWRRDPTWGTVRTFRHQQHGSSPLEDPGEQDITASLDFSQLRAWARDAGLAETSYESQEAFLMRHGALEAMNAIARDSVEGASSYLRLRQLLLPTAMGEAFRVAIYEKGIG